MTVLLTGATTGRISTGAPGSSGLIMLLHINAGGEGGGVVFIPPQALVQVPGHGQTQLDNALTYGGASLLVQSVEQLTQVPINHYARINFTDSRKLRQCHRRRRRHPAEGDRGQRERHSAE